MKTFPDHYAGCLGTGYGVSRFPFLCKELPELTQEKGSNCSRKKEEEESCLKNILLVWKLIHHFRDKHGPEPERVKLGSLFPAESNAKMERRVLEAR